MTGVPYVPTPFATPQVNPAVGSFARPFPYISYSQYLFAPTGLDTTQLIPQGSALTQEQTLFNLINRACGIADRYLFGADPASKGASLCASSSIESDYVKVLNGELRLRCDYKPVLSLLALDIGNDPSSVGTVGQAVAATARFGRKVIYVPTVNLAQVNGTPIDMQWLVQQGAPVFCVWNYVNGYPHTQLAANAVQNATSVVVKQTDGNGGLFGIFPGSQLDIVDNASDEMITVSSIAKATPVASQATITTANPLQFAHTVPAAPDFIPVTALPADVHQALILITGALIKERGGGAIELAEAGGGREEGVDFLQKGDDLELAAELLDPFRVHTKK